MLQDKVMVSSSWVRKSMVFLLILYEYLLCGLYDLLGLYLPSMLSSSVSAPQVCLLLNNSVNC